MRLICGPQGFSLPGGTDALRVALYRQRRSVDEASAGEAVRDEVLRRKLEPDQKAWDLISIALSVITADFAGQRGQSPDGWTREFVLDVAVSSPDFWTRQSGSLAAALGFLTTDRWVLRFHSGGFMPPAQREVVRPTEDSVVLLSGGLDSLIGATDLVANGRRPFAVSQIVRGDAEKQVNYAARLGGGLSHLQLNPNVNTPDSQESSQRARSLIFIAFGVLVATSLQRYCEGDVVPLFVCENGFIAINPPLTGGRIGSLSTRTAHPAFLRRLQSVFDAAELRVEIQNPYAHKTKGEMLRECRDQGLLVAQAAGSTSCGRFQRFGYRHCGRCVPCQVRRAAFLAWGQKDTTDYVYQDIGRPGDDYSGFDDVRSIAIALAATRTDGFDAWLGHVLPSFIPDRAELKRMLQRGLGELQLLHTAYNVR